MALALLAVLLVPAAPSPGRASSAARLPRFDTTVIVERLRQEGAGPEDSDNMWKRPYVVRALGVTLGYQWSDRQRTEAALTRSGTEYVQANYFVPGYPAPNGAFVSHRYRHDTASLAQMVTFRRNHWVVPQLGLGAVLDFEHRESYLEPIDPQWEGTGDFPSRADRERALGDHPTRSRTRVLPFVLGAVKLYVSRHLYVRGGASVTVARAPAQLALFAGVGRDW